MSAAWGSWFIIIIIFIYFQLGLIPLFAAGQTSEGVLANFFNSLLTKKAGTGGAGTAGGGNNTPGTVRKSGERAATRRRFVVSVTFWL